MTQDKNVANPMSEQDEAALREEARLKVLALIELHGMTAEELGLEIPDACYLQAGNGTTH